MEREREKGPIAPKRLDKLLLNNPKEEVKRNSSSLTHWGDFARKADWKRRKGKMDQPLSSMTSFRIKR